MTDCKPLTLPGLAQFTGSEHWYRHGLVRNVLYTDGAHHVAETGGAYWLLDEIALTQKFESAVQGEEFQLWKLTVLADDTATLACEDGDGRVVFSKAIAFTDFPAQGVALYCCNRTILLPWEY
jgi:hypothetical protein